MPGNEEARGGGWVRRRLPLLAVLLLLAGAGRYALLVLGRAHFAEPAPTPILYDRHGAFLAQFGNPQAGGGREYGFWPLPAVPPRLALATLAAEDRRFWAHPGVDARAVLRAAWQDLTSLRRRSGASTIAMQVARMQHPAPRTLWAKALEAGTALLLVGRYGHAAVLAQYLRLAPYGNGSHGIAHAARWYFDKPAADLGWAEIALLAALPRAPAADNPRHPAGLARARARGARILGVLRAADAIPAPEYRAALTELATLAPRPAPRRPPEALHPILRLGPRLSEAGPVPAADPRRWAALDLALQRRAALLLAEHLARWRPAGAQQAALMVVERGSAAVRAAVGSDLYGALPGGAIDYTATPRSPGSTLKPFLYAAALQGGLLRPTDLLNDGPGVAGAIRNADSLYLGRLPPSQALANSRNVPAAALLRQLGLANGFDLFRRLGLAAPGTAPESLGLAMALGALPTRLDHLLGAYTALAEDGVQQRLRWFETGPAKPPRRMFTAAAAREVALFLADPLGRLPGFGRYGPTEYPFPVAVKTGTSQGYRDAWTVAWSDRYLVGAWVGRPDAGPMAGLGGAEGAARLVRAVLLALHGTGAGELSGGGFAPPPGSVPVAVCAAPLPTLPGRCGHTLRNWVAAPFSADPVPADPVPAVPVMAPAEIRLSVVTPAPGTRLWRNPESPPAANRLLLRAAASPGLGQIVWYVDGAPFAVGPPDAAVAWPLQPGAHRFQVGLPLRPERSAVVLVTVR